MRKVFAMLTALVFTCGIAFAGGNSNSGGGTGGGTGDTGTMSGTGQEKQITGTVQSVNKDQKKITITGPQGNQVQYTLNDDTIIVSSTGEAMKVGDLKTGSKVTITYTGSGANAMVTKVQVQEGK